MFSPIVATAALIASSTVRAGPAAWRASIAVERAVGRRAPPRRSPATSFWNSALRATKSVSELTSTMTARLPGAVATPIRPSAATRPAFLAALARPLVRSQSTAASMSPLVSVSAALQSIMPAPVLSRSSFTIPAVIGHRNASSGSASRGRLSGRFAWPTQSSRATRPLKLSASSTLSMSSSVKSAIWS